MIAAVCGAHHGEQACAAIDLFRHVLVVRSPSTESSMNDSNDVSVLNGLIKTTLDSMKGYEDAAKDADST